MLRVALSLFVLAACSTGTTSKDDKKDDTGPQMYGDEDGDGYLESEGDCDDGNDAVYPGATELCNGIDDNCNDEIDEDVQGEYYEDYDGDGFGNPDSAQTACDAPDGYVQNGTDCDDQDDGAYPGANEVCDEIDNNCDGSVDEGVTETYYADTDGDGFGDADAAVEACSLPEGYVEDSTD